MGDKTAIEWTDATWNPIGGCSIKSPGCKHCYAQKLAGTRLKNHPLYAGTTTPAKDGKPVFNGTMTVLPFDHPTWSWPLNWHGPKAPVRGAGARPLCFPFDMSDLFHGSRPLDVIRRAVGTMALAKQVDWQILTKRPDVMAGFFGRALAQDEIDAAMDRIAPAHWHDRESDDWPLPNFWLGTSAERQEEFDARWPYMRALAAAGWIIFLSLEPLLERIVLPADLLALGRRVQIITGGLSGSDEAPVHPDSFRSLRDQCRAAGVPFFFKQWGEWGFDPRTISAKGSSFHHFDDGTIVQRYGKKAAGRLLDGREWNEFPGASA